MRFNAYCTKFWVDFAVGLGGYAPFLATKTGPFITKDIKNYRTIVL